MLILSRKPGQSFRINGNIEITVMDISGDKVKIGIEAPREMKILRNELIDTMEQNKIAAGSITDKKFLEMLAKPRKEE
jgi:carbon storage regulator